MIVVAGVSGHVGSVAAKELLAAGKPVKVLVRDSQKGLAWSKQGAEVAVASLENQEELTRALRGASAFFVLLPPNPTAPDFYGWQRETAAKIGAAVKASAVPHTVLLSSIGADLDAGNGPVKGLFHLENALRASGTTLTAIRAGFFQENIVGSIGAAKHAGIYPSFAPSQDLEMPMIATRDIGKLVAAELLRKPDKHEIIDLHGPAYSARQLAGKIGAALGKAINVVEIPPAGHVAALVQAGIPQQMAESYAEMYAGFGTGKIVPKGDRFVQGTTAIDEILPQLV